MVGDYTFSHCELQYCTIVKQTAQEGLKLILKIKLNVMHCNVLNWDILTICGSCIFTEM